MNGGKLGPNKKSNNHLNLNNNGTLGGSTHGYGPIGAASILNIKSNNSSVTNTMQGFSHINMQAFKNSQQTKDQVSALTKINGKLKKRALGNNLTGLQSSCNTNPGREKQLEKSAADREASVDPPNNYNMVNVNNVRST